MDPNIGELTADVLIEDGLIAAIEPDLGAIEAEQVDVTGAVVMPGFVATHRRTRQTPFRGAAAAAISPSHTPKQDGTAHRSSSRKSPRCASPPCWLAGAVSDQLDRPAFPSEQQSMLAGIRLTPAAPLDEEQQSRSRGRSRLPPRRSGRLGPRRRLTLICVEEGNAVASARYADESGGPALEVAGERGLDGRPPHGLAQESLDARVHLASLHRVALVD